jgi:hypothetical protein
MSQVPALAAAGAAQTATAAKPNIIVIISDQFRCDCLGAMGLNPMGLTPNLDQMAAEGVLFRSAFCNQPVCAPARGAQCFSSARSKDGRMAQRSLLRDDGVRNRSRIADAAIYLCGSGAENSRMEGRAFGGSIC